jgi:hypothetical protein
MCPGRLRMVVDIVGCTLVGYFLLSGAPLLDLYESAGRDHSYIARKIYRAVQ